MLNRLAGYRMTLKKRLKSRCSISKKNKIPAPKMKEVRLIWMRYGRDFVQKKSHRRKSMLRISRTKLLMTSIQLRRKKAKLSYLD